LVNFDLFSFGIGAVGGFIVAKLMEHMNTASNNPSVVQTGIDEVSRKCPACRTLFTAAAQPGYNKNDPKWIPIQQQCVKCYTPLLTQSLGLG